MEFLICGDCARDVRALLSRHPQGEIPVFYRSQVVYLVRGDAIAHNHMGPDPFTGFGGPVLFNLEKITTEEGPFTTSFEPRILSSITD